jgi:hypothetical protein
VRGGQVFKRGWQLGAIVLALTGVLPGTALAGEVVFSPQNNPPNASDGWQAGTCNTPTCAPDSPKAEFYETAAGHPPFGITQFIVRHDKELLHEEPQVDMKTLRVDLPVGLSVNPGAVPQCPATVVHPAECPAASKVGESQVTVSPEVPLLPPVPITASVYNLTPKPGQPARFGFTVEAVPALPVLPPSDIYLEADVAWESDFHEGFTIQVPKVDAVKLLKNRLIFNGRASTPGDGFKGFFLTTPSTCFDPTQPATAHTYSTYARADSLQNPDPQFPNGSPFVESTLPPGTSPKDCGSIPFNPALAADPGTSQTDSPAGAAVEVKLPIEASATGQETSAVRTAKVALPAGMGLNPSAAEGLAACTDDQFKKGVRVDNNSCPPNSRIGTVTVATPPLPEGPLTGDVYVGTQKSRDPQSGEQFRILVEAKSLRYGVVARLVGNVSANPQTGQLTTTFDDPPKFDPLRGELPHGLPQVPFTSFRLDFNDGPKAPLTSPPICGPFETTSALTPWSAQFSGKAPATPAAKFTLTSAPGGGPCAKTMAERPFAPSFDARPKSDAAATFTPFSVRIARTDGQQELKGVDITLPPGATAKLAGVPYCPPAAIAAAAARAGAAERGNSSCPDKSQIGVATIASGSGSSPLQIGGKAFLAGPYSGAPLSLVVVTPAVAGPFDLGTVVVRVPIFVDSETAQIHAVSDAIPDVFGGAKLDVRSVFVNVNKDDFTLNGTNCSKFATAGTLKGGGADPANPAAWSSFQVSDPVQLDKCAPLKFRPKLNLRLFGATKRSKHPRLRAILKARPGDANIARASVGLPHALFLDQASLFKICTRVQFAANACPKKSIYGRARAFTPLLGNPVEGPVYLRSSNNELPDMVAHLQGQIDIDLVGRIDSFKGGIRTTFDRVPDVPVTKFVMTLPGGKRGLLVASKDLCKGKGVKAIIRFKAQNGKKLNKRQKLRTPCKKKHGGKPKRQGQRGGGGGK